MFRSSDGQAGAEAISPEMLAAGVAVIDQHRGTDTPVAVIASKVCEAMLGAATEWALVPRQPTKEMLERAYWSALAENAAGVWESMIEAVDRSRGP